jgi:hypothetical protein
MLFTTLVVITALCLLIPMTRIYAVIGTGLLLYFYTTLTLTLLGVLIISGIAVQYFLRRKSHAH